MNNSKIKNPMRSNGLNDDCRQTRQSLPHELLGVLDEPASSGLYQHISQCRSCLKAYIALQAAADMASPIGRAG